MLIIWISDNEKHLLDLLLIESLYTSGEEVTEYISIFDTQKKKCV